ncbi:unnamed protein product [Coffea canephora]|uniref:beta-galactosidase n=1 Tax=Coffea canephora TaxID=49390 RepID=A0A068VIF6_COFCA|nr:unnamed protein product [Coffea canephora]
MKLHIEKHLYVGFTFAQTNTCNGFYCDYFSPNKAYKPKMCYTWFLEFYDRNLFFLKFLLNYCCDCLLSFLSLWEYHGGTNLGRIAGGQFIATSYDYDAPLHEYGM